GIIDGRINTGWLVEGGLRTLFFNPESTAAWTLGAHLIYQYNDGNGQFPFVATVPAPAAPETFTIRHYPRWYLGGALGRDWFLAPAYGGDGNAYVRFGGDWGGRWGTSHLNLNIIPAADAANQDIGFRRISDVTGSFFIGVHSTIEIPRPNWTWFFGFRAE